MHDIKILYEDNHLLVVEKPPNMLSQGDITGDVDLLSILKDDLKQRYGKPGDAYLGLVHRIDRPVGGAMVFAKTSKAASRLTEQIKNRNFEKTYYAIVHGVPDKASGIFEHYLEKDERSNTVSVVPPLSNRGKKAILEFKVLESTENMSMVEINLHTGRSHQIRVQFATEGYPLYGDRKYGSPKKGTFIDGQTIGGRCMSPYIGEQIALWSVKIAFIHPTLKNTQEFRSIPPNIYPWSIFKIN